MTPCGRCGVVPSPSASRCPRAGEGDCVLAPPLPDAWWIDPDEEQPFLRYRRSLWSWTAALAAGLDDGTYRSIVTELDDAVAAVDGRGFRVTPCGEEPALAAAAGHDGALWVKDETGNVSGSHKARHLFGIAIHLAVLERAGRGSGTDAPLAIASCGNAALGAAVVAAAARRTLRVYVPPVAAPSVIERLGELGAELVICERRDGEAGDPCYLRFREAVSSGAVAFGCQGPDNGLTIDGGRTLGFELGEQVGGAGLDRLYVQVGGGALATSVTDGLSLAAGVDGPLGREPALHPVQTEGCHPLSLAHDRVADRFGGDLEEASRHRAEVMVPWPTEPSSAAGGILDDETYDWQAVLRRTRSTGGRPVVVSEADVEAANRLVAEHTDVAADHTGTAGLAGLVHDVSAGTDADGGSVAVLLTGRRR
ncbi:MAG: PLP-dependent lyase/thiolase [Actinomycetota bacterium]